jgi:hypothetical protein
MITIQMWVMDGHVELSCIAAPAIADRPVFHQGRELGARLNQSLQPTFSTGPAPTLHAEGLSGTATEQHDLDCLNEYQQIE